jgi:para-aminobenzoate synthetase component I
MRQFYPLPWHDSDEALYDAILSLSKQFGDVCLLDSNHYKGYPHSNFGSLMALGKIAEVKAGEHAFRQLEAFWQAQHDWIFGYLSYDLKSQVEPGLPHKNAGKLNWPLLHFFVPRYLLMFHEGNWQIGVHDYKEAELFFQLLSAQQRGTESPPGGEKVTLTPGTDKSTYVKNVERIKARIRRGDIFEMNYCMAFYAENCPISPETVYRKLDSISQAPFGAFLQLETNRYLLCSSPERYLKKQKDLLISQPIKGTRRRSPHAGDDKLLREELLADPKERSENVMIVDLVRNDLSRVCLPGSVRAEELFGIYTFEQVHQMISTVTGQLQPGKGLADIFSATFPMGSMTGAPKVRAMELIDQYEDQPRGVYSGAVGYITPAGNFDFNVVIRSIVYDAKQQYLSAMVGSAITAGSDAEQEYEECLLKLRALQEALGG